MRILASMAREKVFRFKQFNVINDKTAMKVGTDGVLLGAWCDVAAARRVLDVGTGCGVIALMIAQRNAVATIHAIDIEPEAVAEAVLNFQNSPWGNRLEAELIDFNVFGTDEKFDHIVSNPPFFTSGVLPPEGSRNLARHATALSLEELVAHGKQLLTPGGLMSIIVPADAEQLIRRSAVTSGLNIGRLTAVIPVEGAAPKRLLCELVNGDATTVVESMTIQDANRNYTQQYIDMTRDFYLKM